MSAGRHPKSAVAAALDRAKGVGFVVVQDHNGHRWGWLISPRCGHRQRFHGTPQSPETEAKKIDKFVEQHTRCSRGRRTP